MSLFSKNLSKTFVMFAVISFLLMGTFGLSSFGMTMKMDADGHMTMSDCFMPGMTTLCNMSPLDHIAQWQNMFTALPIQLAALALLVLVVLFLIGSASRILFFLPTAPPIHSIPRQRYREIVFDPLRLAFSDGILNPKIF